MTAAWSTSSLGEAYLGEMYLTAAGDDGVPVVDDTPPDPYTLGGRVTAYRWDILNPVSYTHLDVYKRQSPMPTTRRSRPVRPS